MPPAVPAQRDLRLDVFRGLALWLIFVDHIPSNIVNWGTMRNFGFSDAAEIFVFISGYTAAFVYGRAMRERGFLVAGARILQRAWQIYIAHVFLFVIYMAEIAFVSSTFENPLYHEEMGIFDFLKQPDVTLIQALLLRFKPVNMDVLPLYIVLLVGFPADPVVAAEAGDGGAGRLGHPVARSPGISAGTCQPIRAGPGGSIRLPGNCMFVLGAWCALGGAERIGPFIRSPIVLSVAAAYLVFALLIVLGWYFSSLAALVPRWLNEAMYPIDKINLDVLRIAHFLALAAITVRFVRSDWPALQSVWFSP